MSTRNTSKMKHLSLLALLAIAAPLTWGEEVYYCVEEASQALVITDNGTPKNLTLTKERFTLKHIEEANRIALAGEPFSRSGEVMRLVCDTCSFGNSETLVSAYYPVTHDTIFSMKDDQFVYAQMVYGAVVKSGVGTCTKF